MHMHMHMHMHIYIYIYIYIYMSTDKPNLWADTEIYVGLHRNANVHVVRLFIKA